MSATAQARFGKGVVTRARNRTSTRLFAASSQKAFTLAEMVISMAASSMVIGALLVSSLSMERSLRGSEKYAMAYSDGRRLIDFIARDLRRAVAVAATNEAGARYNPAGSVVTISGPNMLILSLPGYYKSNTKGSADFDQALEVVGTEERLDYGTTGALAETVEVTIRKVYVDKEASMCFVRQEAGVDDVIVRDAENMQVQVTMLPGGQSASVKTWFRAPFSRTGPQVYTYDRLLLRNPPLDAKP